MTYDDHNIPWDETVRDIYRQVVADGNPEGGMSTSEARKLAGLRIKQMIDDGLLTPPDDLAINAAIDKADKAESRKTDAVIEALAQGRLTLDYEDDPVLDFVVRVGHRMRKPWRNVTPSDLIQMDQVRYGQNRSSNIAYEKFHHNQETLRARIDQHLTVGQAVDAGELDWDGDEAA